ncbi:hypothetical protein V6N13_057383 [Hibiscus sabdariffa]
MGGGKVGALAQADKPHRFQVAGGRSENFGLMESVGLRVTNDVESAGHGSFGVAYASLGKFEPWPCPVGGGVLVTPTRPTTRGFGHVVARSRWLCATCQDIVTPNTGRPCVATVLGGVSRPSNVRASDLIKSQWVLLLRHPAHPCPALLPIDFLSSPI